MPNDRYARLRTLQPLTTHSVESATAGSRPQIDLFDARCTGLALRVSRGGTKAWCFTYTSPRIEKRARIQLGTYPATSLDDARNLAISKRHLVERGIDPRDIEWADGLSDAVPLIESFARITNPQQRRAALDFMKAMIDGMSARYASKR